MFIRTVEKTHGVEWGNGKSYRLLTKNDNMGYTICHTIVYKGTESRLQYLNHLEACYCLSGTGKVISQDGCQEFIIKPGVLYVLNEHDAHYLIADKDSDLILVSVFNPPLNGDEKHVLSDNGFSQY
ncbi:ectoine synthase [Xenorhabdus littoralis]|uniref:ectoine synthase n=1 Tax=Xenorhabdus littoralis TaxID=2582835 RepID=UPI0029E7FBFA|nr:ectoine synthase [Xenorhabdus sp. psl]MDX7993096.1 L-ectoine synthase [Xenorhabdus sp. psl]